MMEDAKAAAAVVDKIKKAGGKAMLKTVEGEDLAVEFLNRSAREVFGAPHQVLLVLDATTGQNGLQQARLFAEAVEVTGIVLTKLDGTAKGGIVIPI